MAALGLIEQVPSGLVSDAGGERQGSDGAIPTNILAAVAFPDVPFDESKGTCPRPGLSKCVIRISDSRPPHHHCRDMCERSIFCANQKSRAQSPLRRPLAAWVCSNSRYVSFLDQRPHAASFRLL